MSGIIKPPVTPIWGDDISPGPSADFTQPADAYIKAGWTHTSGGPPRGYFNWLLNFCANAVRYFSRRGIPDWDTEETYLVGDITRDPADGQLYRCFVNTSTTAPHVTRANWVLVDEPVSRRVKWRQNFQSDEALSIGTVGSVDSTFLRPGRWSLVADVWTSGNATATFSSGSDGPIFKSGFCAIGAPTGASDVGMLQYATPEYFLQHDAMVSIEWDAAISAVGANGADIWMVLGDLGPLGPANNDYIAICKRHTDTNWQAVCKGTTQSAFNDLGVAPVAANISVSGTPVRFKITWIGSGLNGGTSIALIFVNGVLTTSFLTHLPAASRNYIAFGVINAGTTGRVLYISDVTEDIQFSS